MNPDKLYQHLRELLGKLNVEVRTESFDPKVFSGNCMRGGICRIGDRMVVLVDARASIVERIAVLATAASGLDYHQVYVAPAVQQVIENRCIVASPPLTSPAKLRLISSRKHR